MRALWTISGLPRRILLVVLAAGGVALADPAGQLLVARQAVERGDTAGAEQAYRRAFQAPEATAEERKQALAGLLSLARDRASAGRLAAFLQEQLAKLPAEQQPAVVSALVGCLKARDASLRPGLALLAARSREGRDREARRALASLVSAWDHVAREVVKLAAELRSPAALRAVHHETPRRPPRSRRGRPVELADPRRPTLEVRLTRLAPPSRERHRSVERVAIRSPQRFRYKFRSLERVVKPPPRRRLTASSLASVVFSRAYRRASELAAQGFYEAAKAQYATFMELFPDGTRTQQAARYALQLFRRERGAAQETSAMVAYLRWTQAVFGPKGHEYAEYLAFSYYADEADPLVVAREAEGFARRHPQSRYLPAVRLELAVALDAIGDPRRAIEVLRPVAATIDSATRAKAAYILAWLLIFQGEGPEARKVLQNLASQNASESRATAARKLLDQMAARPLPRTSLPEPPVGLTADQALARALLAAGDAFLRKGDDERAMDLYDLFLHLCEHAAGYYAARLRIERLKQTGKVDEE